MSPKSVSCKQRAVRSEPINYLSNIILKQTNRALRNLNPVEMKDSPCPQHPQPSPPPRGLAAPTPKAEKEGKKLLMSTPYMQEYSLNLHNISIYLKKKHFTELFKITLI